MPATAAPRINVGDTVSVAVGAFGADYARSRGAVPWHTDTVRDEGTVVGKEGRKFKVKFADDAEHVFERKALQLERSERDQPGRRRATAVHADDSEDSEDMEAPAPQQLQHQLDSSDGEDEGPGDPEHDGGRAAEAVQTAHEWKRDDRYGLDERARQGYTDKSGPRLNNLNDWENCSLFSFALHFLPLDYVDAMAALMEEEGQRKHREGNKNYKNWRVNRDDLLQWIGVWLYMLAFPQAGDRREYFMEPKGGFGPRHRLADYLRLGRNGDFEKGAHWFEAMHACLKLPTYANSSPASDAFHPVRRWWDDLRDAFHAAVTASWLLVLDESMLKWLGRGMPGLMVILRKPTPIGLEIHTLCCAMCGVLVWFEVYEGKERMARKEFNDEYPKSVALTLRMLKPFFSSGRVLVADSWFGSVACAIALFAHGIFAVMNVKTATKGFPKDELMTEVDEIKGKSAEARAARRARRGKQIAFVRNFVVGSRNVNVLAAGHNKKVPLLLVCTYGSMLPGDTHTKTWQVNRADGSVEFLKLETRQPQVHALYRKWMNVVDVFNRLRQGVTSMSDVWSTKSWVERHFSEGLGFWEVNVFKALIHFYPKWKELPHGEFRARLAWAFLTLGKHTYPKDAPAGGASFSPRDFGSSSTGVMRMGTPPLEGSEHIYARHAAGTTTHRCAYCGHPSYFKCVSCEANGLGTISVCGPKASKTRNCRQKHVNRDPILHATFQMSVIGREHIAIARRKRSQADSSGMDGDADEDE